MGCHTLYFTKTERTQEEATEICLKLLKQKRNGWWKSFKNHRELMEFYRINYETSLSDREYKNSCLYQIKILNKQIKMVSNGRCKRAIWNHQSGFTEKLTEYIDGVGLFVEVDDFNGGFRVYDYPDVYLFSLQETLDYISLRGDQCKTYEYTIELLTEFWSKYPNGMICFG